MRAIITGASSGIGAALARELARRGWAVALLARREELLNSLVAEISGVHSQKAAGAPLLAAAVALPCDVCDSTAVRAAVRKGQDALGGPFDLAVANAGLGTPSHASKFVLADAELMMRVNVNGMFNLFDAVIPSMIERRSGRFAGVASIAGLRGLPTASIYSASKAAMQAFLEASRVELLPYNVSVTTVNPGFVITPMSAKIRFKMPFLMKVDDAARVIADGFDRGSRVIEFPKPMSVAIRAARLIPDFLWDRVMAQAERKLDPSGPKR